MNSIFCEVLSICILGIIIHQSNGSLAPASNSNEIIANAENATKIETNSKKEGANVQEKKGRSTVTPWGTLGDGGDNDFSNFFRKFINSRFRNSLKNSFYSDFLDDDSSSSSGSSGSNCNMWGCSGSGQKCGMYGCSSRLD